MTLIPDGSYTADIAQATAYQITGVPFFVFDTNYGVSGSQEAQVFAAALRQVVGEGSS